MTLLQVTDPICSRTIGLSETVAGAGRAGRMHFFCSVACFERFLAMPTEEAVRATPVRGMVRARRTALRGRSCLIRGDPSRRFARE